MRAFYTDLNDWSAWGMAGREYLRLVRKMGPFVVRTLPLKDATPWVTGDIKTPGVRVLDVATNKMLRTQARWINPPTTIFYHGWLSDLCRIERADTPPGGVSVAIVNWHGELPGDAYLLNRFSVVWASTEGQCVQLRDAGLRAFCVPVPLDGDLDVARPVHHGWLQMIVAAGSWEEPDNLREVTAAFLESFAPSDSQQELPADFPPRLDRLQGYGLHLVVPGRKSLSAEELCELDPHGRPFGELPAVSIAQAEPDSTEAWLNLLAYCDTYFSLRDDAAGDYFALLAGQAGCRVVGRRAVAESYQSAKAKSSCSTLIKGVAATTGLRDAVSAPRVDPGELHMAEHLFPAAMESAVQTAAAVRTRPQLRLGVVVSHHDQRRDELEATLRCLCPQLLEDDVVVVADWASNLDFAKGAKAAAQKYGAHYFNWMGPTLASWSMAWLRNAGARAALQEGAQVLYFVDCGVLLPQSAAWLLRYRIEGLESLPPCDCASVTICTGQELLTADDVVSQLGGDWAEGHDRTTDDPGNLMVRAKLFEKLCGFDEEYKGSGYETRDFRIRATGWEEARWVDEVGIVAYRQPGRKPLLFPDVSTERAAEARFKLRRCGDKSEVNPHGWGML